MCITNHIDKECQLMLLNFISYSLFLIKVIASRVQVETLRNSAGHQFLLVNWKQTFHLKEPLFRISCFECCPLHNALHGNPSSGTVGDVFLNVWCRIVYGPLRCLGIVMLIFLGDHYVGSCLLGWHHYHRLHIDLFLRLVVCSMVAVPKVVPDASL